MEINPEKIELNDLSKNFEFFKYSSEIDDIDDLEKLRNIAKSYFKLYLKQQEVLSNLGI